MLRPLYAVHSEADIGLRRNIGRVGLGGTRVEVIEVRCMVIYLDAGLLVIYMNHSLAVFGQFKSQQGEPSVGAA